MSVPTNKADVSQCDLLDARLEGAWHELLGESAFVNAIQCGEVDKRLYALYMIQTYHYTFHNARNQALVGVRALSANSQYLRYCFTHAAEETGHEHMALHDLRSIGLADEDVLQATSLPATDVLIAYLYWVSATGNPLQRLGYSYWAETSYHFIDPLVEKIRSDLSLQPSQMSFFVAHSGIDEKHAAEVRRLVSASCSSDEDWAAVSRVMVTSLELSWNMIDMIYEEYLKLADGQSRDYKFLNALAE